MVLGVSVYLSWCAASHAALGYRSLDYRVVQHPDSVRLHKMTVCHRLLLRLSSGPLHTSHSLIPLIRVPLSLWRTRRVSISVCKFDESLANKRSEIWRTPTLEYMRLIGIPNMPKNCVLGLLRKQTSVIIENMPAKRPGYYFITQRRGDAELYIPVWTDPRMSRFRTVSDL